MVRTTCQPNECRKLTKRFLMSLPEGLYLVSGVTDNEGCPSYEGAVARLHVRDMQWEKIKQVHVDQRQCFIFDSKAEYAKWYDRVEGSPINRLNLRADVEQDRANG